MPIVLVKFYFFFGCNFCRNEVVRNMMMMMMMMMMDDDVTGV